MEKRDGLRCEVLGVICRYCLIKNVDELVNVAVLVERREDGTALEVLSLLILEIES